MKLESNLIQMCRSLMNQKPNTIYNNIKASSWASAVLYVSDLAHRHRGGKSAVIIY